MDNQSRWAALNTSVLPRRGKDSSVYASLRLLRRDALELRLVWWWCGPGMWMGGVCRVGEVGNRKKKETGKGSEEDRGQGS
jgi:hypothetical protein